MEAQGPTYKIAFSQMATGKLPQGDPRWESLTKSFVNRELDVLSIYNEIFMGHSYCAWLNGDRRKAENFQLAQHIAIDLDTEDERSDIDHLAKHAFYQAYGGLIHTSPSHTDAKPRARVIFFLDQPITNGDGYRKAYETVASLFDGADPVCKDPARFFYGAHGCFAHIGARELPVGHIRTAYKRMVKAQPQAKPQQAGIVRLDDYRRRDEASGKTSTAEEVRRALACITYRPDYQEWRNIVWSVAASLGKDAALPVLMQWRSEEVQGEYEDVIKSDRGKGIGPGTLFYIAKQNGFHKAVNG